MAIDSGKSDSAGDLRQIGRWIVMQLTPYLCGGGVSTRNDWPPLLSRRLTPRLPSSARSERASASNAVNARFTPQPGIYGIQIASNPSQHQNGGLPTSDLAYVVVGYLIFNHQSAKVCDFYTLPTPSLPVYYFCILVLFSSNTFVLFLSASLTSPSCLIQSSLPALRRRTRFPNSHKAPPQLAHMLTLQCTTHTIHLPFHHRAALISRTNPDII